MCQKSTSCVSSSKLDQSGSHFLPTIWMQILSVYVLEVQFDFISIVGWDSTIIKVGNMNIGGVMKQT